VSRRSSRARLVDDPRRVSVTRVRDAGELDARADNAAPRVLQTDAAPTIDRYRRRAGLQHAPLPNVDCY